MVCEKSLSRRSRQTVPLWPWDAVCRADTESHQLPVWAVATGAHSRTQAQMQGVHMQCVQNVVCCVEAERIARPLYSRGLSEGKPLSMPESPSHRSPRSRLRDGAGASADQGPAECTGSESSEPGREKPRHPAAAPEQGCRLSVTPGSKDLVPMKLRRSSDSLAAKQLETLAVERLFWTRPRSARVTRHRQQAPLVLWKGPPS